MSYILDALRKSEAARRSREVPDLLAQTAAPLQPAPTARSPKYAGRPALAMAAIGLSALAVALWLRFAPGEGTADDASVRMPDAGSRAGATGDDAAFDDAAFDDAAFDPAPIERQRTGPEAEAVRSLDPGRPPEPPPGMSPAAVPVPAIAGPAAPAPATAAAPRGAATQPTPPITAPSAPPRTMAGPAGAPGGERVETAVPAADSPTPGAAGAGASRPAVASLAAGDGRPVALADIAPEQRRLLPPLRMSMHLWSEAPERRLLVLDGQRLRQGDVLGEVVVERIDRDGAVLAWRGARIALPAE